jgi:chromosome segregation ATPase
LQSQIDNITIPDYSDDISNINNQLSTMNQSITELQDLRGDGNDVDLTDINNSIINLQFQINSMNNQELITTRVSTLGTYYSDMKIYIGNTVTNINTRITYLQSQINSITVPYSTNDINNLNDSIINLQYQIDSITIPDYTNDISNLNDSIAYLQSQIDTLSSDTNNNITEINEKLSTTHTNYMGLKGKLGTAFTSINSIQDQLNGIIIPHDYTSDINSINDSIAGLVDRLLTLDDINLVAHNNIRNEIYPVQEQVNRIKIPPDYSADILVLQGEITRINARFDAIDDL